MVRVTVTDDWIRDSTALRCNPRAERREVSDEPTMDVWGVPIRFSTRPLTLLYLINNTNHSMLALHVAAVYGNEYNTLVHYGSSGNVYAIRTKTMEVRSVFQRVYHRPIERI